MPLATAGMPDVSTVDTYGGVLQNYDSVVDPTTDRDATAMDQALEDCAEMTHTAARAWARITLAAAAINCTLLSSDAGWGNSVPPVIGKTGTGIFTLTWSVSTGQVTDGLGNTHNLNFKWAIANIEGAGFGFAQANVLAANVVRINMANSAGAANDMVGVTILVRVG
jgi:hypothetical protein